ncbi:cyclase [Actinomadura sp. LD22]|uniref:Cyclase n=2 Tax=Actinomadura physcomitrii TaxID=2650748 RepID=A0A6I4MC20_9ACTN|nr:cyclase [Actinomadura physcomitrii]
MKSTRDGVVTMAGTSPPDTGTADKRESARGAVDGLPVDQLKEAGQEFVQALMVKALKSASGTVKHMTERLGGPGGDGGDGGGTKAKMVAAGAEGLQEGKSPLKAGLKAGMTGAKETAKKAVGAGGGGKGGGEDEAKVINIVEKFDVGLPRRVAYDQWTRFSDFPSMTSKVEKVEQESDEKLNWRAKIFLSHRDWESTIVEQVPDERILWKSEGPKGYVDGAVTFHELSPDLTRILLVAEYHPDGFLEKTANLWRAQGRRLRLDFKHIERHMMTRTLLERDDIEGWRGEIRDGEVVRTHEDAVKEEKQAAKD